MKRPNIYSRPLDGDRTENYHPADLNGQYAKDLNTYIDYLENTVKELAKKPAAGDNTYTTDEQVRNLIASHDIYYNKPEEKPSHVFFFKYMHEGRRLLELVQRIAGNAVTYRKADKKEGIYSDHAGGYYKLPRCEFLLHSVKTVEERLLDWYKENKCSQGDSYSVTLTKKGRWKVSHSNDYPMQHGDGSSHILTEDEFAQAMMDKAPAGKSK